MSAYTVELHNPTFFLLKGLSDDEPVSEHEDPRGVRDPSVRVTTDAEVSQVSVKIRGKRQVGE